MRSGLCLDSFLAGVHCVVAPPSFSCQTPAVIFDSRVFWDTEEFMVDFCEVPVVLWILNKSKIICMCIFCAHMLFRFSPNVLHYGQTSPPRTHLFNGHCSRSLTGCSDANLNPAAMLFFFD